MTTPLTFNIAPEELDPLWPVALCLSLVTGTPFSLLGSEGPLRLRAQQLALARAAAELAGTGIAGDGEAVFPADGGTHPALSGDYQLDAGGALGAPAVLACLQPALALAGGGTLHLKGSTHPAEGPIFETLGRMWPLVLGIFGAPCELRLERAGFAGPQSGVLSAKVSAPTGAVPGSVELMRRGTLHEVRVTSLVAGPQHERATRQSEGAAAALRERGMACVRETLALPASPRRGGGVLIEARFEHSVAAFSAVTTGRERAEVTGRRAAEALADFLGSPGAVEEQTASQLLLWGALLASGRLGRSVPGTVRLRAPRATPALRAIGTAAEAFLPVRLEVEDDGTCSVARA